MTSSTKIKKFIKQFESLRLTAYLCPAGVWTIGWGHTDNVKKDQRISIQNAEILFESDILNKAENYINNYVKILLNQNEYDALTSLIFNIGGGNFFSSTLLKKLNLNLKEEAANEFLKWNKYRKDGKLIISSGLDRRRKRERDIFLLLEEKNWRISSKDIIPIKELEMLPYNKMEYKINESD